MDNVLKADASLLGEYLYHSEQPIGDDVASIHAQHIKTIVNLCYFDHDDKQAIFGNDVTLINESMSYY